MCFLKPSISAWGRESPSGTAPRWIWKGLHTWKLATEEERKKHFWTSGYNELLSSTKFFEMSSYCQAWFQEETQIILNYFYRKLNTIA